MAMIRRFALITAFALLAAAALATPASAWYSNGGKTGVYATHNWVLDHAVANAGEAASWVDLEVALGATDDPDTYGTSKYLHSYYPSGPARGGPQKVADEYHALLKAYQAGDYAGASKHLGLLSHYYSDVCVPYHTVPEGSTKVNPRHDAYERDVFDMTRKFGDKSAWAAPWARTSVPDVRAKTVSAGKYARSKYSSMDASYKSHQALKGYAYDATGYVLRRAVNDLTDIICAVEKGQGLAPVPASTKHYMPRKIYYYPRNGQKVCSSAKCYDKSGKPMEGVAVKFKWPFKTVTAYTDANGYAYSWEYIGSNKTMSKKTVKLEQASSGVVATDTTWYVPTPVLKSGDAGVMTWIGNTRPKRNTVVKVKSRFVSTSGKPVAGLPVTFSWYFKSGTVRIKAVTDSKGYARCSYNIGKASKTRTYVRATTYSGGHKRSRRASFIPQ
jgi:hypothetical protein